MRWVALLGLLVAGCGTFQLADRVTAAEGQTKDQLRLDMLDCKDQARLKVNEAGTQVGDFLLGFTIVGYPVAYQRDKEIQKSTFRECMVSRGYVVVGEGT